MVSLQSLLKATQETREERKTRRDSRLLHHLDLFRPRQAGLGGPPEAQDPVLSEPCAGLLDVRSPVWTFGEMVLAWTMLRVRGNSPGRKTSCSLFCLGIPNVEWFHVNWWEGKGGFPFTQKKGLKSPSKPPVRAYLMYMRS